MEPREHAETTTLTIRNVDRRLRDQLRVRAARHGQSMEAELRQILREALAGERPSGVNLAEAIQRRMAPLGGVELELPSRTGVREPPRFE
jgi:plasmid stability protein